MDRFGKAICAIIGGVLTTFITLPVHATSLFNEVTAHKANVIFIRHALAPGFGDHDHFDINDCSTQRNLSQEGRDQARALGQLFRLSGLQIDEILSSRWCRCKDTATEMNIGLFETHDGLNSFYDGHVDRTITLNQLKEKLSTISEDELIVMITHQVVIQAMTGVSPSSGGIVLFNTRNRQANRFMP